MKLIMLIIVFCHLIGCVHVPMAKKRDDVKAKSFVTTPGKANIYVFRDGIFGASIKTPIRMNGEKVADIAPSTFAKVIVEPGKVILQSESENKDEIQIQVEPGQNYFVRQSLRKGSMTAHVKLRAVSDQVGQNAILNCKLVKNRLL